MGNNITTCLGKPPAPPGAETSSRCVTPTATTAHNFVVDNYSLLNGTIGVDKFVSSTTFSAGGRNWNIRFYPDGDSRGPGHAAAFLHLVGGAKATSVKAKFTLSLLGRDGKVLGDSKPVSIAQTFESEGVKSCWGAIKFVEQTTLQDAGCFTVRCDLTVVKDTVVHKIINN
ncbi:hypothetical protein ACQJBY_011850 [Aegilops geniculata]